ncbi:MAG TPA: hypothetical protein PL125_05405 [Candidatus Omnitrophota bacterium]|nr:hypothetical protein [Candidatus Omnitrophota bacterium]
MSWLNFGAWLGRISFLKVRFEKWSQGFSLEQLDVKVANRVLGFLVTLLCLYFAGNLFISLVNLSKVPRLESNIPAAKIEASFPEPTGLKKAASYYLDKVRERDIFTMGLKKIAEKKEDNAPSAKSLDLAGSLKLVGISWSTDPDAMIEDTKSLKTYFVKRGDMVGDAKVQAIFKDKVVLNLDNEEFELR